MRHSVLIVVQAFFCVSCFGKEFRSINGSNNNKINPDWGTGQQPIQYSLGNAEFEDGVQSPSGARRPSAREISNKLFSSEPLSSETGLSSFLILFGQLVTHDIARFEQNRSDPFYISVPICDQVFDKECEGNRTMPFFRLEKMRESDQVFRAVNLETSWIDASFVYGSHEGITNKLRTFQGGLLKVSTGPNGDLLPENEFVGLDMAHNSSSYFAAGDTLVNQNTGLLCLVTLFYLEHNRWARKLAEDNADWTDEQLFQKAGTYVIAVFQKILYHNYLPALLGKRIQPYHGYNPAINPSLDASFLSAFRYGHNALDNFVLRLGEDWKPVAQGPIEIGKTIFRPKLVLEMGLEPYLRGLMVQKESAVDDAVADGIRNSNSFFDLIAVDIQRERDLGVPSLNNLRRMHNLQPFKSFAELTINPTVQQHLTELFGSVEDVGLYTGGHLETPGLSGVLPPTFATLVEQQFMNLQSADRFYYERTGVLDETTFEAVQARTLSGMIRDLTKIWDAPDDVFRVHETCSAGSIDLHSTGEYSHHITPIPNFQFSWRLDLDTGVLHGRISASVNDIKGWVAVGFGSLDMAGADVVMGYHSEGGFKVEDMFIPPEDPSRPIADVLLDPPCQDDLLVQSNQKAGGYEDGVLWSSFSRKLLPGNRSDLCGDVAILIEREATSAPVEMIFAFGTSRSTGHGLGSRIGLTVDLLQVSPNEPVMPLSGNLERFFILHGLYMVCMWMIAIPASILVIRFNRTSPWSSKAHRVLGQFGALAAIMLVASASTLTGGRVFSTHGKVGWFVIFWLTIQITFGWALVYGLRDSTNPIAVKVIRRQHQISGTGLVVLGIANCYLGIGQLLNGEDSLRPVQAVFWVYVALLVVVFLKSLYRRVGKIEPSHISDIGFSMEMEGQTSTKGRTKSCALSNTNSLTTQKLPQWKPDVFLEAIKSGKKCVLIGGYVFDIGNYMQFHPGGARVLLSQIGQDATELFFGTKSFGDSSFRHRHSQGAIRILRSFIRAKFDATLHPKAGWISTMEKHFVELKLSEKRVLNTGENPVWLFCLTVPQGEKKEAFRDFGSFLPGQIVTLLMNDGESIVARDYHPLVGQSPGSQTLDLCIKLYKNGQLTKQLAKLSEGSKLRIHGPRGAPILRDDGSPWKTLVLISGGVGFNASISMIQYHLLHVPPSKLKIFLLIVHKTREDSFFLLWLADKVKMYPEVFDIRLVFTRDTKRGRLVGFKVVQGPMSAGDIINFGWPVQSDDLCVVLAGPPNFVWHYHSLLEACKYTNIKHFSK